MKKKTNHYKKHLILAGVLFFVLIFSLGILTGYFYSRTSQEPEKKGIYIEFLSEVYDKIKENYWDKTTDEELSNLFKQGSERLIGMPQPVLRSNNKEGLEIMWNQILKDLKEEEKKEFSVKLAELILTSLKPVGRNRLYTIRDEEILKDNIQNINPEVDLYETLGVSQEASQKEIEKEYQRKTAELESKKDKSPEEERELEEINYAYQVLSEQEKREKYDQLGIEPTVFSKLVRPDIFYIYIKKFSPNTLEEFKLAADRVDDQEGLDSLILDLRGNIGGSIDILPYFLGPFIGQNQYAFEFFHQGEYEPFKTKTGWLPSLVRYKKVVILIDSQTQSTAELMAATLKKYNVGITVGLPTRGWGTIEKVFSLEKQIDPNEKYSIFLVHSLTLADDGQPIEGRGVEPLINTTSPDWEEQLFAYFHYDELIKAVKELINQNRPLF